MRDVERIALHDDRLVFEGPQGEEKPRVVKDERGIVDVLEDLILQPLGRWPDRLIHNVPFSVRAWEFVPKRENPLTVEDLKDPTFVLQEWVLGITALLMDRLTEAEKGGIRNAVQSRAKSWMVKDMNTARELQGQIQSDLLLGWFDAFGVNLD